LSTFILAFMKPEELRAVDWSIQITHRILCWCCSLNV